MLCRRSGWLDDNDGAAFLDEPAPSLQPCQCRYIELYKDRIDISL